MNRPDVKRCLVLILFFLLAGNIAEAGQHEHKIETHRHSDLARTKNPVPMTEESIGKGMELFEKHCILCHGRLVKEEKRLDLADDKWIHGDSDGEIFHVITNGIKGTTMTGFKKELTSEMRWHLVNYIKSLGREKKGEIQDQCKERGVIVKNLTTRDLWFKRDGGDCYLWDENKTFAIKTGEKVEIFSDLVCETRYCKNIRSYADYRAFDTNGDCSIRVLPACSLSDM